MKANWKTLFLASLLAIAAGCNAFAPAPTPTLDPSPTALPTPTATLAPTNTPTTIPNADTPTSSALPLPSGTPAADWEGIPVMPNALAGNGDASGYSFTTNASADKVQAFYESKMVKLGWSLLANGQGDSGATLIIFIKGTDTATISIIPQADGIIYVMLVK